MGIGVVGTKRVQVLVVGAGEVNVRAPENILRHLRRGCALVRYRRREVPEGGRR